MINQHLLSEETGTKLMCHTNRDDKPVIFMEEDDNMCCNVYIFESENEINWLIKKLEDLKEIHFNK